jgi:hypothetical protein
MGGNGPGREEKAGKPGDTKTHTGLGDLRMREQLDRMIKLIIPCVGVGISAVC